MDSNSLTTHLLSSTSEPTGSNAFKNATQTPFLHHAGLGTLPKSTLSKWLAQDRLYAQAYIRFASLLLANVPLPSRVDPNHVNEQLVDCLIGSIANVRRELKFFEDTASRYGLELEAEEVSEGVRRYRELFFGIGEGIERGETGLLEGLVVLWGTEKCYLEAWIYAKSFGNSGVGQEDEDGGALRKEFIPNWTSGEFVAFVEQLGWFVDELWKGEAGKERGVWKEVLTERWTELLDVERIFWPVLEE
ncbi:putative transcription factor [Hyphodiscus hymeniophilus]|uniref:Transcription factor n=1 Tax=Hyphodiscus hymeniophilus TaxID=353542 RepID=A0A9P6VL21_9HELO|nr:putative transcription factor [Hyphodiscus hymeniophilus]